uniref:Uncharacterized protein n=1 Tax=Rhizophora mucronata TaxID=61149 RepID=A0A2P2PDQ8_RHIMU
MNVVGTSINANNLQDRFQGCCSACNLILSAATNFHPLHFPSSVEAQLKLLQLALDTIMILKYWELPHFIQAQTIYGQ